MVFKNDEPAATIRAAKVEKTNANTMLLEACLEITQWASKHREVNEELQQTLAANASMKEEQRQFISELQEENKRLNEIAARSPARSPPARSPARSPVPHAYKTKLQQALAANASLTEELRQAREVDIISYQQRISDLTAANTRLAQISREHLDNLQWKQTLAREYGQDVAQKEMEAHVRREGLLLAQ